jgi:rhodanese-related sulfurtransferase
MKILLANIMGVVLSFLITSGICFGISAEELEGLIDRHEKITLIDVRGNAGYTQGHIPGAINIPARLCPIKRLPPVGRVIVYGGGLDESSVLEAVDALNEKPGIAAEMLDGGILRWEALNYPSTRKKGLERENPRYISYQKLHAIVRSNPDLVLFDLRKIKKKRPLQSQSRRIVSEGVGEGRSLTDFSLEFPGVRVITASAETVPGDRRMGLARAGGLRGQDSGHSELYVLIDIGDGVAEEMARSLKAAGIKRFVILAGGEESIVRKGQSELKKK